MQTSMQSGSTVKVRSGFPNRPKSPHVVISSAPPQGAWMIHVVLIATGKVIIDVIPGVTQNISWTAVNLTYLAVRGFFLHIHPAP